MFRQNSQYAVLSRAPKSRTRPQVDSARQNVSMTQPFAPALRQLCPAYKNRHVQITLNGCASPGTGVHHEHRVDPVSMLTKSRKKLRNLFMYLGRKCHQLKNTPGSIAKQQEPHASSYSFDLLEFYQTLSCFDNSLQAERLPILQWKIEAERHEQIPHVLRVWMFRLEFP